mmetsp:Transcript_34594/g.54012  ORF Transcript_34594/g.54012 Transcript_34594/m.54012 type:complete len:352 (-) Transcript_34594:29-1084(-)
MDIKLLFFSLFFLLLFLEEIRSNKDENPYVLKTLLASKLETNFSLNYNGSCADSPKRWPNELLDKLYFFVFTSSSNPTWLHQFMSFYQACGIPFDVPGRARIILQHTPGGDLESCFQMLKTFGAEPNVVIERRIYSSSLKAGRANEFLREVPQEEDVVVIQVDNDEFLDMDGETLLEYRTQYGGFVRGRMVDRVTRDWVLKSYDGTQPLSQYYPRRCTITPAAKEDSTKWIMVCPILHVKNHTTSIRWKNSHQLKEDRAVRHQHMKKLGVTAIKSLPFSHYRFAERPERKDGKSKRSTRVDKLSEVDEERQVRVMSDFMIHYLEEYGCGKTCPVTNWVGKTKSKNDEVEDA